MFDLRVEFLALIGGFACDAVRMDSEIPLPVFLETIEIWRLYLYVQMDDDDDEKQRAAN